MQLIFENLLATSGRVLLGLYFIIPGITKVTGYDATSQYMADHGMILISFFLILTIIIQIGGGLIMVAGYQTKITAFILAGLTLVISVVMHDFWTMPAGELQTGHETQNFVKNMAIMAGLLAVAGMGGGRWSLDARLARRGVAA